MAGYSNQFMKTLLWSDYDPSATLNWAQSNIANTNYISVPAVQNRKEKGFIEMLLQGQPYQWPTHALFFSAVKGVEGGSHKMLTTSLQILYNILKGKNLTLGKRLKIAVIGRGEEIPMTRSLSVLNFVN